MIVSLLSRRAERRRQRAKEFALKRHKDLRTSSRARLASVVVGVCTIATFGMLSVALTRFAGLAEVAAVISSVLIDLGNVDRAMEGLPALSYSPVLERAAKLKAEDMATRGYFAHTAPDGTEPWHWFEVVGYRYVAAGENLALNFADSGDVQRAWMESPAHRANILGSQYAEVGIGTAVGKYQGQDVIFIAQMFGTPIVGIPVVYQDVAIGGERVAFGGQEVPAAAPASPTPAPATTKSTPKVGTSGRPLVTAGDRNVSDIGGIYIDPSAVLVNESLKQESKEIQDLKQLLIVETPQSSEVPTNAVAKPSEAGMKSGASQSPKQSPEARAGELPPTTATTTGSTTSSVQARTNDDARYVVAGLIVPTMEELRTYLLTQPKSVYFKLLNFLALLILIVLALEIGKEIRLHHTWHIIVAMMGLAFLGGLYYFATLLLFPAPIIG